MAGIDGRRRGNVHATQQTEQEASRSDVHNETNAKEWQPPTNLDAPPARNGYKQKWIRVSLRGEDDTHNLTKSLRQGWEPRKASTVPKEFHPPTIKHGEYAGYIGAPGLILCEMPVDLANQRNEYYRQKTIQNTRAISEDLMRVSHPGMPLTQDRKSTTTVGRKPVVAPDE